MNPESTLTRRGFLQRVAVGAGASGVLGSALSGEPPPGSAGTGELPLPPIPYPKSDAIQGIRWLGSPLHYNNNGDVWTCTWADDDRLYSVADDTAGWNLSNPNFPAKWFEDGGRKMWIVEGGNYRGPQGGYNFTVQQLELIL